MRKLVVELRGENIRRARLALGLSQKGLAAKINVTQPRVSQWENLGGTTEADTADRLCEALGVEPEFLRMEFNWYGLPGLANFRKLKKARRGDLNRWEAEYCFIVNDLRRIFDLVDLQSAPNVHDFAAREGASAMEFASTLRRRLELPSGPIRSVTSVAERAGAVVVTTDKIPAGVSGMSLSSPAGSPPLIFVSSTLPPDRSRFTIAHELGHLLMHSLLHPAYVDESVLEDEANAFAAELLFPAEEVEAVLGRVSLRTLRLAKTEYGISLRAGVYRARDVGLLERDEVSQFMKQIQIRWGRNEPDQPARESGTVLRRLFDFVKSQGYHVDTLSRVVGVRPASFRERYRHHLPGHMLEPEPSAPTRPRFDVIEGGRSSGNR